MVVVLQLDTFCAGSCLALFTVAPFLPHSPPCSLSYSVLVGDGEALDNDTGYNHSKGASKIDKKEYKNRMRTRLNKITLQVYNRLRIPSARQPLLLSSASTRTFVQAIKRLTRFPRSPVSSSLGNSASSLFPNLVWRTYCFLPFVFFSSPVHIHGGPRLGQGGNISDQGWPAGPERAEAL